MSIQREYILPNCKLILEGLSDEKSSGSGSSTSANTLSILVNADCYVAGKEQPLSGGMEFFQALVMAVSSYAQEFLSGVRAYRRLGDPHGDEDESESALVQFKPLDTNLHRLLVRSPDRPGSPPLTIDLNSVQLFDLVEAVDQFLADRETLPQLALQLRSVSKSEAKTQIPVTQRALPAAIGVSSLAIAAMAFFFVPVPDIERPVEDPKPQPTSEQLQDSQDTTPAGSDPPEDRPSPPSPDELSRTSAPATPIITDPETLATLEDQLYDQIDEAWQTRPEFDRDLIYRVGVGADGAIVGYEAQNDLAREYSDGTPLSQLVYKPVEGGSAPEPVALFEVIFQPDGRLQVDPWQNQQREEAIDLGDAPEITDRAVIDDLVYTLQGQLIDALPASRDFVRPLTYRVGVIEDGTIVDYEAVDRLSEENLDKTPLQELHQPSAAVVRSNNTVTPAAIAQFRVVFRPTGVPEVSPWDGF
ncbi:MAG: DUF4335 domain-containing protein [Cyanobacteria bacterium J007]|jgi:hypothetical protein|nr:MAG: DUF4335 domain-containing protein [Cyanobacteria bacterium J007]